MSTQVKLNNNQGDVSIIKHLDTDTPQGDFILDARQLKLCSTPIPDRASLKALKGLKDGDVVYQSDIDLVYVYEASNTEDDNSGTIIEPDSSVGRLVARYNGAINVKWFGAKCDATSSIDGTDDTVAVNKALSLKGSIFIPSQTRVTKLDVYSDTKFFGVNGKSIVWFFGSEQNLINIQGAQFNDFEISNIKLLNTTENTNCSMFEVGLLPDGTFIGCENITFNNVVFNNSASTNNVIVFSINWIRVNITNCKFIGILNNAWVDNADYYAQSLIMFSSRGSDQLEVDKRSRATINNCSFENGGYAIRNYGTLEGGRNSSVTNCTIHGQNICAIFSYHSSNNVYTGNDIYDVTAPSRSNGDGAVVWLDSYIDDNNSTTHSVFSGNTIKNCIGNGIYTEEYLVGTISDNTISVMKKRTGDTYTVVNGATYTSDGGAGILITGGNATAKYNDNTIRDCEGAGIRVSWALGVHAGYMDCVRISNNSIYGNLEDGIFVEDRFGSSTISDNSIYANGASGSQFAGIRFIYKLDSLYKPSYINIVGNTFRDIGGGSTGVQKSCIVFDDSERTFISMSVNILSNILHIPNDGTEQMYIKAQTWYGNISDNVTVGPTPNIETNMSLGNTSNPKGNIGKNNGIVAASVFDGTFDDGSIVTLEEPLMLGTSVWDANISVYGATPYSISIDTASNTDFKIHIKDDTGAGATGVLLRGTAFNKWYLGA